MTRRADRLEATKARRRAALPARLLRWSLLGIAAIVIGVGVGGGTYAAWNVSKSIGTTATIRAGSAGLTATDPKLTATGLYPGRTVYASTQVRNSGTTPLVLALDGVTATGPAALGSALRVSVGVAASDADCTAGRTSPVAVAAAGAPVPAPLGVTLARGATTLLCVGVGLPDDAPVTSAGSAAAALTVTLSGTQVP